MTISEQTIVEFLGNLDNKKFKAIKDAVEALNDCKDAKAYSLRWIQVLVNQEVGVRAGKFWDNPGD